ncbi:MAG: 30S ribosome-binding factor [Chlamydiia bacterium]|nr:30S ribosome-binding factor [Chlamydiia bacterium]
MKDRRVKRLNSLLREVVSEVIMHELKNPHISKMVTITDTSITKDLRHAKIYISVIEEDEEIQQATLRQFNEAAGFIAVQAAKKVTLRYFPELTFYLDTSSKRYLEIDTLLDEIKNENAPAQDEENPDPKTTP